jgi:homoserine dehydrogenase
MSEAVRLGLAGLGTVGLRVAQAVLNGALSGVQLTAIAVRDPAKKRDLDLKNIRIADDTLSLAAADDVDIVVELIGGENGVALDLTKAALQNGKSVVTANKAMLARHAVELADLAEANGGSLAYEAAVAGGIPVIKTIREALVGNRIDRLSGILNGTCNYMLSQMAQTGQAFDSILQQAQKLGYAEADPSFDIDGVDAAQKLTLLASLAFGIKPNLAHVTCTGISAITQRDIHAARDFDCHIKLIARAEHGDSGTRLWVGPALLRQSHPLSDVDGVTNAVLVAAEPVGELMLVGPGAGGGATASAVLSDIADLAGGFGRSLFARHPRELFSADIVEGLPASEWYLRFLLEDKPGSMARVTQILADKGVSIEQVIQRAPSEGESRLPVVFITHKVEESHIKQAVAEVRGLQSIVGDNLCLPVFTD